MVGSIQTCVVTGAAGFIGSMLCRELLEDGFRVVALDNFDEYYDPAIKKNRIVALEGHPGFNFTNVNITCEPIDGYLRHGQVLFHLAGQPGVQSSWGSKFDDYTSNNIVGTQRVLEACKRLELSRIVYASSSSVYGNSQSAISSESDVLFPYSPYGVSKLAGEHLASLYAENFGLSTVSLRFFTVFGPGQRPDMAIAKMIRAGLSGGVFPLRTSPSTIRDFTYVGDIVSALKLAGLSSTIRAGSVYNVCGGSPSSMANVLELVDSYLPRGLNFTSMPSVPGDVGRTGGDASLIRTELGWEPNVSLEEGIAAQVDEACSLLMCAR